MNIKRIIAVTLASMTLLTIQVNADTMVVAEPIRAIEDVEVTVIDNESIKVTVDTIDKITIMEELVNLDVQPQMVNGKWMVPLRAISEALGFEVTWDQETKQVQLAKSPHFTSVTIGLNSYFKHRMAPVALSAAPVIIEGRTLVPIEFLQHILGYGMMLNEGELSIFDEVFVEKTGFIQEITKVDEYYKVVTAETMEEVEMYETLVLIVSDNYTIMQIEGIKVGDEIRFIHAPMMTMSIPAQTGAVIIY